MRILFCSNYFTHHQIPLSDALYELTNYNYCFVAHKEMDAVRKNLGWGQGLVCPYICSVADAEKQTDIDVLIVGSFPEQLIAKYDKRAKLLFRYSERILKTGNSFIKYSKRFVHWHICNPPWRNTYLLSASAFASLDYSKFGLFRNSAYKWGYFPECRHYESVDSLIAQKDKTEILWCGRFIDWKHPDDAIKVAGLLKKAGYSFSLKFIGTGEMEQQLRRQAEEAGLLDTNVEFLGAMPPEKVRDHMEHAGIYLFTSDRQEGWGAVLNEAMNSACAVAASDAIGATPYLVKNGQNGCVYHSGDVDELFELVKRLLDNPPLQESLGHEAYRTIADLWNAEIAAKRLIKLSEAILGGEKKPNLFADGPCSKAEIIREDWYVNAHKHN